MPKNRETTITLRDVAKRERGEIVNSKIASENFAFYERESQHAWGYPDSPLLDRYSISKKYPSIDSTFRDVVPKEHVNIKNDIEATLLPKKGRAIAIELGGVGSTLFQGFTDGFFQRTAGVCLTDYREMIDKTLKPIDARRNHSVIPGDMTTGETKEKVQTFLESQKADLIISRMEAGRDILPHAPHFMGKQADYWYRQLAEGGLLYVQLPSSFQPYIENWVEVIESQYQGKIEVTYSIFSHLRLHKLSGAPEHLPLTPLKLD